MNKNKYVRTDLAAEAPVLNPPKNISGIEHHTEKKNFAEIFTIKIKDGEGEALTGKPVGTYVTLSFDRVLSLSEAAIHDITQYTAEIIRSFSHRLTKNKADLTVLVAGLGNRDVTSDAIGPLTAKNVIATRHIKSKKPHIFRKLNHKSVSVVSPGVLGQTGIETYELIKGAVSAVSPDLLIVIDALAAKDVSRLASTIQICDTGISPGSGIGNTRHALNAQTLGIPVIAIGVPTMVSSSTLVYNALEKAGIESISQELTRILDEGISFFVTLNETDAVIKSLSDILSESINQALSTSL